MGTTIQLQSWVFAERSSGQCRLRLRRGRASSALPILSRPRPMSKPAKNKKRRTPATL